MVICWVVDKVPNGGVGCEKRPIVEVLEKKENSGKAVGLDFWVLITHFILEHPPHPFHINEALPFAAGLIDRLMGTCSFAHELLDLGRRKIWRIASRKEPDEFNCTGFREPNHQIVCALPKDFSSGGGAPFP